MLLSYEHILASRHFYESIPANRREAILKKIVHYFDLYKREGVQSSARPTIVEGTNDVGKFRINKGERIIFSISQDDVRGKFLILREYSNHDDQINKIKNRWVDVNNLIPFSNFTNQQACASPEINQEIDCIYYDESGFNIEENEIMVISDEWLAQNSDKTSPSYNWFASIEQYEVIKAEKYPLFLKGSAGTGKSMVLFQKMQRLAQTKRDILYITISSALRDEFERIYMESNPSGNVSFLTIDMLYENLLRHGKDIISQNMFSSKFEPLCKKLKVNVYAVWCEISGIIKSHLGITEGTDITFREQLITSAETTLSWENYEKVNKDYSFFNAQERETVYSIVKEYDKWVAGQPEIADTNQLAAQVIKAGLNPMYDIIMIDEVQDFTELQLDMLMELAKGSDKGKRQLIYSGDINQNVRPTYFNFKRLYNIYHALGNRTAKENTYTLTKNYRSCKELVLFLNEILSEQRRLIGSEGLVTETGFRGGNIPLYFESSDKNLLSVLEAIWDKPYAVILVPSEDEHDKLAEMYPDAKSRIFTVQEAKGLEYRVVFAYNITSTYEHEWESLEKHSRRDKQLFGYIYVAASRARDHLTILEKSDNQFLQFIDDTAYRRLIEWDLRKVGLDKEASAKDMYDEAIALDKAGIKEKARQTREAAEKKEKIEIASADHEQNTVAEQPDDYTVEGYLGKLEIVRHNQKNKLGVRRARTGDVVIPFAYDEIAFSADRKDVNGRQVIKCTQGKKTEFFERINGNPFKQPPPMVTVNHNIKKKKAFPYDAITARFFLVVICFGLAMISFVTWAYLSTPHSVPPRDARWVLYEDYATYVPPNFRMLNYLDISLPSESRFNGESNRGAAFRVIFSLRAFWDTGYYARIIIENLSDYDMCTWTLTTYHRHTGLQLLFGGDTYVPLHGKEFFFWDNDFFDGEYQYQDGLGLYWSEAYKTTFTVMSARHENRVIPAGNYITFWFVGKTSDGRIPIPDYYTLELCCLS